MENIRYEVWLQNQDKLVTQCTIASSDMNFIDPIFFRIRTFVHCVTNNVQYTLENTEGAITNGQSRETGNIGYTRQVNQKHNTIKTYGRPTCWRPLCVNKHKQHNTT
jgi:hypothetical protein